MNAQGDTAQTRDKLVADLKLVVADAEDLLKITAGQAGDKVALAREKIQASLEQAKAKLTAAEAAALDKAKLAASATDEYVHQNPWKAVGVAAGVGLILGMLIGRR